MNLSDLNFDIFQRFNIIRILITLLPEYPNISVLDVGGFPGTLSECMKEIKQFYTVDTHICNRENYIPASGTYLPFKDKSFDVVVASDTLEHIPASERNLFLNELMRVSKNNLILGTPFHTRENEFAESSCMKLYERVYGVPNIWLAEHKKHTLPDLELVITHFSKNNMYYKIFPNGNIVTWYIMEVIQTLLNAIPGAFDLFKICNTSYNQLWSCEDNREPSYRKVFIASFGGEAFNMFLHKLNQFYPEFDYKVLTNDTNPIDELSFSKLEYMDAFFEKLLDKIGNTCKETPLRSPKLLNNYISQLEKIVNDEERLFKKQQKELDSIKQRLEAVENSIFYKILKKVHFIQ